jgi:hypothetical protein
MVATHLKLVATGMQGDSPTKFVQAVNDLPKVSHPDGTKKLLDVPTILFSH